MYKFFSVVTASLSVVTGAGLLFASTSFAQTSDFYEGFSALGAYSDPSNWADGSPATILDDAFFQEPGDWTVFWDPINNDTNSRSLTVRNGNYRFLQGGTSQFSSHSVANDLIVESGRLHMDRHTLNVSDDIEISSEFRADNGGTTTCRSFVASPNADDSSSIEISGEGTEVSGFSGVSLGRRGFAGVTVSNFGLLATPDDLNVGFAPLGGSGFLAVQNEGRVQVGQSLNVVGGFSSLCIIGGQVEAQQSTISGDGFLLSVDPGGMLTTEELSIGSGESVAFGFVTSGGEIQTTGNGVLGEFLNSTGEMNVCEAGSKWTCLGPLEIGRVGTGNLIIGNGGQVITGPEIATLGRFVGGQGNVRVSGNGSLFFADAIEIGTAGHGEFMVEAGGRADLLGCQIGSVASSGSVRVEGDGSRFLASSITNSGVVSVNSGGEISTGNVAVEPGGEICVDGAGSEMVANETDVFGVLSVVAGADAEFEQIHCDQGGDVFVSGVGTVVNVCNDVDIDDGDLFLESGSSLTAGSTLSTSAGGSILVQGDDVEINVGQCLRNIGQFLLDDADAEIFGNVDQWGVLHIANSSNLSVVGNVLNDTIFGGIFVESSSSLTVNGVFNSRGPLEGDFSGEINLNGEIRPGGSQIGGIFFPGDLNFSADSDLEITLAGEAHDAIGGNVRLLGGSLTLVFTVGNVPPVGTEFEICQGVESGQFGGLPDGAVVSAALGRQYVINYVDGSVFLTAEELLLGDVNGDGLLNLLDVAPFVELLASGNYLGAADVNMDGSVNLLDVTGFVELLAG